MKKRWLAIGLICTLLTGCGAMRTEPMAEEPAVEGDIIAYVPLDDRPDNEERVLYLAESLGYTLEIPERDDYQTRLKGQPLNSNGTQFGDREDMYEWLLEQEAEGCDRYVISLDQLLSGGLVNSRSMFVNTPLCLSDGTMLTEYQALEQLLDILAADGNNRVWLLDSVMRLAPTVGYDHWDLEGYNALRSYGMQGRPKLAGDALTIGNIEADYRLTSDGSTLSLTEYGLNEDKVTEYLSARSRKLELSAWTQELVSRAGYENFRILIGIDDSSEEDSIQKNEIAFLRQGLREDDALLSGVDDLAFKAVTKLYLEELEETLGQSLADREFNDVYVEYFGETEDQPACAYDYQPLQNIVAEHLAFFGLDQAQERLEADMQLLVLTQPADANKKAEYYEALIARLHDNAACKLPTILIDAGNGQYGTAFHKALTEEAELGWLLSYAGFLDMAIVTGTAMSHGVARYAYLTSEESTNAANRAFARTLADSILKDFCYKHVVRDDILNYVRGDLAGNADNFWQPEIDREAILARLKSGMEVAAADVIKNLEQSNLIVSMETYLEEKSGGLAGWGGIELDNYRFPWDRAFEIGMDIRLGEFTNPHESILGIYYQ